MNYLTLEQDCDTAATLIANRFIDEYMTDANDAQLKVYLYLVRMLGSHKSVSVSEMADRFNHTEKDIQRAMIYWEKKGLLSLLFNDSHVLVGIRLHNLTGVSAPADTASNTGAPIAVSRIREAKVISITPIEEPAASEPVPAGPRTISEFKKSVSISSFRESKTCESILCFAEAYFGRPLSVAEIGSLYFFSDELHMSVDLIDYLLQYCIERGKTNFHYIEKVAMNWHESGITTPEEAEANSTRYSRDTYAIMNRLGRDGVPTEAELAFLKKWQEQFAFSTDIIFEACDRTVLATDKNRIRYADSILSNWFAAGVKELADIAKTDKPRKAAGASDSKGAASPSSGNRFNRFEQTDIDFAELERQLISN